MKGGLVMSDNMNKLGNDIFEIRNRIDETVWDTECVGDETIKKYERDNPGSKLETFHKENSESLVWRTGDLNSFGPILFSFDRKTIYNLFTDWDKLTEEQKQIFRKENPVLAGLKGH